MSPGIHPLSAFMGTLPTAIRIEDLSDPRVAPYRNIKEKDLERAGRLFIAEGEYVVRRLFASDFSIESLFVTDRRLEEIGPLAPEGVPLFVTSTEIMNGILGMKFHSGVIACGRRKPWMKLEEVLPNRPGRLTLVVCPDISNAENIGSIVRIAAGFGADALILGEHSHDPFWRQSIRVSMGTVFQLPIYQSQELSQDLARLKSEWGLELAATVLDEDAEPLSLAKRGERLAILFGGESQGLDDATVRACDRRVTIPMKLGTDSLNVAVAAGVFLYHFTREEIFSK
jgi:tRNA G18 (ribose-2'-O)-methylase SpoU